MTAVIITSPAGRVTGANSVAREWWKAGPGDLNGRFLLDLFQMEVMVKTEEDKIFQWEWLRAAGTVEPLDMMLVPDDPAEEPFPVKLRLEKMDGKGSGMPADEPRNRNQTEVFFSRFFLRPVVQLPSPLQPRPLRSEPVFGEQELPARCGEVDRPPNRRQLPPPGPIFGRYRRIPCPWDRGSTKQKRSVMVAGSGDLRANRAAQAPDRE